MHIFALKEMQIQRFKLVFWLDFCSGFHICFKRILNESTITRIRLGERILWRNKFITKIDETMWSWSDYFFCTEGNHILFVPNVIRATITVILLAQTATLATTTSDLLVPIMLPRSLFAPNSFVRATIIWMLIADVFTQATFAWDLPAYYYILYTDYDHPKLQKAIGTRSITDDS